MCQYFHLVAALSIALRTAVELMMGRFCLKVGEMRMILSLKYLKDDPGEKTGAILQEGQLIRHLDRLIGVALHIRTEGIQSVVIGGQHHLTQTAP